MLSLHGECWAKYNLTEPILLKVNLRFADDIDGLAGEEEELAKLVERLDKAFTAYGMEISAEKTKLMTNNTSGINKRLK